MSIYYVNNIYFGIITLYNLHLNTNIWITSIIIIITLFTNVNILYK